MNSIIRRMVTAHHRARKVRHKPELQVLRFLSVILFVLLAIGSAWSNELLKGMYVGPITSIAKKLPAGQTNAFITKISPTDIAQRLDLENVLPEFSLSKKIAAQKNIPVSTALRDLITASSPNNFISSLGAIQPNAAVPGLVPNVEALQTFQSNVNLLFSKQAAQPGFLRVWNGSEVKPPDPYPDTVVIVGNNALCTGTLITPQHVITAAHCFCDQVTDEVSVGTSLLNVKSRSKVDLQKSSSHIACDKIAGADAITNIGAGDIALYTLVSPLSGVPTRRISTEKSLRAAASVRAVGFGVTSQNTTGVKFAVDIVIASYDCTEAEVRAGGSHCTANNEMIAAGMNRDTCNGDSGGPVYVLGQDVNLYLAAVTSRAVEASGNCGQGGIYAKLTNPEMQKWLVAGGVPASVFDH
jgi:hypothetical protein